MSEISLSPILTDQEHKENLIIELVKILDNRLISSQKYVEQRITTILKIIHPAMENEIIQTINYLNSRHQQYDQAIQNLQNPALLVYILDNKLDVMTAIQLNQKQMDILNLPENSQNIYTHLYERNSSILDILSYLETKQAQSLRERTPNKSALFQLSEKKTSEQGIPLQPFDCRMG